MLVPIGAFSMPRCGPISFAWTGPLVDAEYGKAAGCAVLVGLLVSLSILLLPGATIGQVVLLLALIM